MPSKAQGLSLNTIVIGAIVLIVLIVMIAIFTGYFGKFVPGLQAATENECTTAETRPAYQGCANDEVQVFGNFVGENGKELDSSQICCRKKTADQKTVDQKSVAQKKAECYAVCTSRGADEGCYSDCDNTYR